MPYPNQHAARLRDPAEFDEFRTIKPEGFPEGVTMIIGIKGDKSQAQAIRADASKMSEKEFRAFLNDLDYPILKVEPATGEDVSKSLADEALEGGDYFSTWATASLLKGEDSNQEGRAFISGIISSDAVDQQGDSILQEGLDFSYFLRRGFLNDDHQSGTGSVIGQPVEVYPTVTEKGNKATGMKAYLYLAKPKAREIYETAQALSKAESDRKLGFSIEGQVLARDPKNPKIITKARVLHCAVTHQPVNPDASNLELIARSLSSMGEDSSTQELAQLLLAKNPELRSAAVLGELQKMCAYKALDTSKENGECPSQKSMEYSSEESPEDALKSVGYAEPATPSAQDALSPLVPSSMGEDSSNEDGYAPKDMDSAKDMDEANAFNAVEELGKAALSAMETTTSEVVKEELSMLSSQKDGSPTISTKMLARILTKTFPGLSSTQAKKLASQLVLRARSQV